MLILGLLIVVAAVVVGVEAVVDNAGGAHQLAAGFTLFGYHLHVTSGRLFLGGVVVGAVGVLGLAMLAAGTRRSIRMRRELTRARRDARAQQRTAPRPVEPEPVAVPEPPAGPDPVAEPALDPGPVALERAAQDPPRRSGRWAALDPRRSPEASADSAGAPAGEADANARTTTGVAGR